MQSQWSRRKFIKAGYLFWVGINIKPAESVITVNGRIKTKSMGTTLIHEHILVDFIGADLIDPSRWKREEVIKKVLPYLLEAKQQGVKTFMDCTPAFLGRDVLLLKSISEKSGLQILTNTGYYGAVGNKYLPAWAFTETSEQLSRRWIDEYLHGIENTGIKPGFIKIGVDPGPLSVIHQNLIKAAAITHLQTGLTICSHTGMATPALEQIEILEKMKVDPSAFVWTHAQNEPDMSWLIKAANRGTWISLDGIGWGEMEKYITRIQLLKSNGLLHRLLISHDAGWYKPGEPDGGTMTGYTKLFEVLIPQLIQGGFSNQDIRQLLVVNPANAFAIRVRKK